MLSDQGQGFLLRIGMALFCSAVVTLYAAYFLGVIPQKKSSAPEGSREVLNDFILAQIRTYDRLPALPRSEVNTNFGVTQDLHFRGTRVIQGDAQRRSYCIGLMLEVYMKACERFAQQRSGSDVYTLRGVDSFQTFRREFYGTDGNRRTFVDALVSRGLGKEITNLEDAKPGDLVQFWRANGTGHAVVFLEWERDNRGIIQGIRFWSVQGSTNGISENSEPLINNFRGSHVIRGEVYIVRPYVPTLGA